jgi:hypothetical protein
VHGKFDQLYLTISRDGGASWSRPQLVSDLHKVLGRAMSLEIGAQGGFIAYRRSPKSLQLSRFGF